MESLMKRYEKKMVAQGLVETGAGYAVTEINF